MIALARTIWRVLTSMRTAIILLVLVALASIPGAFLPQWNLNASRTAAYIAQHGSWARLADKVGLFSVFSAPWFAAIYLLLFLSLVGCLLPRTIEFLRAWRGTPGRVPTNLERLPHHRQAEVAAAPDEAAERIVGLLRRRHWKVRCDGGDVTAEKGFWHEVGNLCFHYSLLGLLIAVAMGKLFGYEGSVLLDEKDTFCSVSPASFDDFRPGLAVDGTSMEPFCVRLENFAASYTETGQALTFRAAVDYQTGAELSNDQFRSTTIEVNHPLRLAGQRLYLIGHGYTPQVTVRFPDGTTRAYAQPFASTDGMLLSEGAIKILDPPGVDATDVRAHQLAVTGLFAPTAVIHGGVMSSRYPAPDNPGLAVDIYRGDVGLESGMPQSTFAIDTTRVDRGELAKVARVNLMLGESTTLDDGTVITFSGYKQWASLQTSYDPAQGWALGFAVLVLISLSASLLIKRRRLWARCVRHRDGISIVVIGALARTDKAGYGDEFDGLADALIEIASKGSS